MASLSLAPLDAAARLAGRRGRAVLHSARNDDDLGQASFVTAEPTAVLIANGRSLVRLDEHGKPVQRFTGDPFDAAEQFLAEHGCVREPRGAGPAEPRVIGYLGYDLARVIDSRGPPAGSAAGWQRGSIDSRGTPAGGAALDSRGPDLWLGAYGAVARWDGADPHVAIVGPDAAARDRLARALAQPARPSLPPSFGGFVADDDASHHMARVERIRDYLAAGDVYQVNLARRMVARIAAPGDLLALYAALAEVAPAPYGALIEADGVALVSGSPERFLASVGNRIETRPIKGTSPAGEARALLASTKDAAEHLMIVDLERNDLGRIAETGSVAVDQLGYVVELPALCHLVSRVSAVPAAGTGYAALLRATFPGGSITGAPKLRAMQIIDELEPARRGLYCGAFGYFGAGGAFDLAIAIRIGVVARDELAVHVGGGIVADSSAADELAETELKARGWVAALDRLAALRDRPPIVP